MWRSSNHKYAETTNPKPSDKGTLAVTTTIASMAEAAHAYEIHPECADEDTNLFWWRRGLIQSPRAVVRWDHTDENRTSRGLAEKGRRVSWSELFLDLVLVTNVALLGDAYNSGDLTVVEASVLYRAIYNCWYELL